LIYDLRLRRVTRHAQQSNLMTESAQAGGDEGRAQ
jgi:hypothetical protein